MQSPTQTIPSPSRDALAVHGRRALAYAFLWWAFTEGRGDGWWFALPVGAAALLLAARAPGRSPWRWTAGGLARFVPYFVYHSILSGFDVARRSLAPRPDIAPHVLVLPLRLEGEPARIFAAHVASLMPGTLAVCLEGGSLRLHALSGRPDAVARDFRALEQRIAALFGLTLAEAPPS